VELLAEEVTDGVSEQLFTVAGVPGVLWTPAGASGGRPLVLMCHGRSQHKKADPLRRRAERYVRRHGWAVAALDAPGHGARVSSGEATITAVRLRRRLVERRKLDATEVAAAAARAVEAVPEWRSALVGLGQLDRVGAGPVGYWGVSMGTRIGVPLVADESRIVAAVFGLAGLAPSDDMLASAAARVTVPVEFVLQSDDEIVDRAEGLALFDALASAEKSLHLNPGGHLATPSFEGESWERFFARHLA
jgi:alpha-beta hydrolase superfamily lysophospholipase